LWFLSNTQKLFGWHVIAAAVAEHEREMIAKRSQRFLEPVHFRPEYCVALEEVAMGDMEMNTQATKLQTAENHLKQLMADV
jgi:hypothetical protein